MSPVIDLAPGAETVKLARELAAAVQANVIRDLRKRSDFERLRGAVALVADDGGTALTLRFDFGKLVVHTGVVGVPDVTIRGPTQLLEGLGDLPLPGLAAVAARRFTPAAFSPEPNGGDIKIYGLVTHPFLVRRLFSVIAK